MQLGDYGMDMRIDLASSVPIYVQIVEQIRHLVATGRLQPGEKLLTIRQLAVDLRVDPNTVAHAYNLLHNEGVISTQRGRGTFVAQHPDDARLARMRQEKLQAIMNSALLEALSLGYPADEVREAFEEELAQWQRNNQSSPAE
ncbi:MAG: GntR family transcriptional regulator [Anaerolineales bacterium]|nr:MAG: GntR family transcriptional regulator [Anaerolineales bacterium]